VLLVGRDAGEVLTGTPFVDGARVVGVIDRTDKGKKVRVFKKKRRKQYRRTQGHRSLLTRVRITDIQA
jgi:large subunit ribosomal protein L21